MIKMQYRLLISVFLFFFIGYSQTGFISGKILDKNDQSPLIGVNILYGENQGASSNIDGEYNLELAPGEYSMIFQYIGYIIYYPCTLPM